MYVGGDRSDLLAQLQSCRHRFLLLFFAFWLTGPASWRWLCSNRGGRREDRVILGYSLYLLLSLSVIVILGWIVPMLARVTWSFMTDPGSLAVLFVLFTVGGWGLGRDIELEEGLRVEQRRAKRLAVEAERAQLLALRAHLDPHFLFNTLNAIAEWCREDPEVAETATLKLADILRNRSRGRQDRGMVSRARARAARGPFRTLSRPRSREICLHR